MLEPIAVRRVGDRSPGFAGECRELDVAPVELGQARICREIGEAAVVELRQLDPLYAPGRALDDLLVESVADAWLARGAELAAILRLDLAGEVDEDTATAE